MLAYLTSANVEGRSTIKAPPNSGVLETVTMIVVTTKMDIVRKSTACKVRGDELRLCLWNFDLVSWILPIPLVLYKSHQGIILAIVFSNKSYRRTAMKNRAERKVHTVIIVAKAIK